MTFRSVLFARLQDRPGAGPQEVPAFFTDLNLDQIVDGITAGRDEYNLKPFFFLSLKDLDAITYRHEVFRDLEDRTLFEHLRAFAQKMRKMREHLARVEKLYYRYQKDALFLDAVCAYCEAIDYLIEILTAAKLRSRALSSFRQYVEEYRRSDGFGALLAETKRLVAELSRVHYSMLIRNESIKVRKYDSEADYSAEVQSTFAKFRQGAVKDYRVGFTDSLEMNHVEAAVLDLVAKLYPELFAALDQYRESQADYLDCVIGDFDREIQFYIAYMEYASALKRAGLPFCYPRLSADNKELNSSESYDLALAQKLIHEKQPVICNDFLLRGRERIIVVSGPNQGGKTTFARTFGQLHYLASLGCLVPGKDAQLFLFDKLFTHFEKEEDIKNLRGKLEDDLVRIRDILRRATPNSVVIMNEIFTSTTISDAVFLSKMVMQEIIRKDLLSVCVTFIDELASMSEKTVSMVSTVVPENPAIRTFKVLRRPADGLAYAISIAEKYRLTYASLKERIA